MKLKCLTLWIQTMMMTIPMPAPTQTTSTDKADCIGPFAIHAKWTRNIPTFYLKYFNISLLRFPFFNSYQQNTIIKYVSPQMFYWISKIDRSFLNNNLHIILSISSNISTGLNLFNSQLPQAARMNDWSVSFCRKCTMAVNLTSAWAWQFQLITMIKHSGDLINTLIK